MTARREAHQRPRLVALMLPDAGRAVEPALYPVLGAQLYATFVQAPFAALRAAFTDRRFLGAKLALNLLVVPVVVFGISRLAPCCCCQSSCGCSSAPTSRGSSTPARSRRRSCC